MPPRIIGTRKALFAFWMLVLIAVGGCDAHTVSSFDPSFTAGVYLITNELAYWNPSAGAPADKDWIATSGSLFNDDGTGWTGPIDGVKPDRYSRQHTDSAVFRVVTRRTNFQNVTVRFELDVQALSATPRTPPQDYDGVHVFMRYQTPQQLYVVSVFRRDGEVAIKKKVPGGSVNDGTYATLTTGQHHLGKSQWNAIAVSAVNTSHGVQISLEINGKLVLRTMDSGTEGNPLYAGGRVGIRGDNANFRFRDFSVSATG